ncbi:MAG: hypothetical protein V3T40_05250 [Nitrososphaerales archaeon]
MAPSPFSLEGLLNSVHKEGISLFEYNNMNIPCVLLKNERFDDIAKAFYNNLLLVDSNLNILHDHRKNVFVEIVLKSQAVGIEQKVLLYGNRNLDFFECLAKCGIIALAQPHLIRQVQIS